MHELIFSKRLPEMRCEIKRRRGCGGSLSVASSSGKSHRAVGKSPCYPVRWCNHRLPDLASVIVYGDDSDDYDRL